MTTIEQAIKSLGLDKRCRGFCRMCDLAIQERFDSVDTETRKSFVEALASCNGEDFDDPRPLFGLVILLNQSEFDQFIAKITQALRLMVRWLGKSYGSLPTTPRSGLSSAALLRSNANFTSTRRLHHSYCKRRFGPDAPRRLRIPTGFRPKPRVARHELPWENVGRQSQPQRGCGQHRAHGRNEMDATALRFGMFVGR